MTEDAKFEDGRETPLNLGAFDVDDLQVISSLAQDAVFPITEMTWRAGERRFGLLLNRFRWRIRAASATRPSGCNRCWWSRTCCAWPARASTGVIPTRSCR